MKRILTYLLCFALSINPAVMDAFRRDGGTVVSAYAITVDGVPCWGSYCIENKQIRIRVDAPDGTLAHEIGHWLYHRQVWSGELRDHAGQVFARTPLRVCTDETFAIGYEAYCSGAGGELGEFFHALELQL